VPPRLRRRSTHEVRVIDQLQSPVLLIGDMATVLAPMEKWMIEHGYDEHHAVRERAYFIWEHEGRPEGRAYDHWLLALTDEFAGQDDDGFLEDEEKVLAGRPDANMPALLTKDVRGG